MFFRILLRYIIGYINIRIEGYSVEKLINICIKKKIFFWNIKREKSTIIYTNIGVKEFKELVKIAKQTGCKVKILDKKGMPFILNKYKKRKIIIIILLFIIMALLILSQFIWNINIEGNENISTQEVAELLESKGIKIGILKNSIDKQKIINEIRLERDDIAWLGIDIQGTNITVEVVETSAKPEIVNEEDYCNVISNKDAQIIKISAQNGIPAVKEGDIVTKGDILIQGWIDGKYTGTRYVHATGEIKGKVWYTQKEQIPLKQVVERLTGNEEQKYKIKINNFTINLFKTLSKFEKYDTIEASNKLKIFSNFYLPIELIKVTNKEKLEEEITYGTEKAKQIGVQKASEKIEEELQDDVEILQKYVNTYENKDYIEVEVTYEVLENIGTKEKIVF